MPQVQFVDDTPRKPEPTGVQEFFSNLSREYKAKQDQDVFAGILGEAQQNKDEFEGLRKARTDLAKSNMSPSNRIMYNQQINDIEKNTIEQAKTINAKAKTLQDARQEENKLKEKQEQLVRDRDEAEQILLQADYEPEKAKQIAQNLSPTSARAFLNKKKEGEEYTKIREKETADYVTQAIQKGTDAEEQEGVLDIAEKAIMGDVQGPGYLAMLKKSEFGQLLLGQTADEATLAAATKKLLEGSKGVFGNNPTEREIFLLLDQMLPAMGKSKEANLAGIGFLRKLNAVKIERAKLIDELTDGGSKYIPNLQSIVNKKMFAAGETLRDEIRAEKIRQDKEATEPSKKNIEPKQEAAKESKEGEIVVKTPDGKHFYTTQDKIDAAKAKGIILEPVKR